MIIESVTIPYYSQVLHVIFTKDADFDYKKIKKEFPKFSHKKKKLNFAATTMDIKHGNYLMVFNIKSISAIDHEAEIVNTITHETCHAINMIFKKIGIYLDEENDECQAYSSGWMAGEIYKIYLNFKTQEL